MFTTATVNFTLDVLVCDLSNCKDLAHFFSLSILQFCGKPTFRTGRFDLQNISLPKKYIDQIKFSRNILRTGTRNVPSHVFSLMGLLSYGNKSESKYPLYFIRDQNTTFYIQNYAKQGTFPVQIYTSWRVCLCTADPSGAIPL